MKRLLSCLGAFVLGALVFGGLGAFFGYGIGQSGTPAVLVRNLTDAEATQVVVHSDWAGSHALGSLSSGASHRAQLRKGDQSVWITLSTAAGKTLEIQRVYATTGVVVVGAVCGEAITLEPVL